jgi:tRNA (adenine37-N6)-methyltransferase
LEEMDIFPEDWKRLKNIAGFSHLIIIYHLRLAEGCSLVSSPFLDNEGRGIFSIRQERCEKRMAGTCRKED